VARQGTPGVCTRMPAGPGWPESMRAHLRTAVIVLLTLGLLGLFLRHANLRQVWAEVATARVDLLVMALLATAMTYVFRALRWQYLLRPMGHVSFGNAFRTTVIGFAATALLPARPGEVLRPWLLARREGFSATAAFATVILERVLDTVMVLLLFGWFLLITDPAVLRADAVSFERLKVGGAAAALVSVAALVAMFFLAGHPGTIARLESTLARVLPARLAGIAQRFVRTFGDGLATVRQPLRLTMAMLWSVPLWLSIAAGIWFVSHAFRVDLPFSGAFLIMALLVVGVAVPTPGAVGGFHYFYRLGATVFYGAQNEAAVGAAIVLHAVSFVPVALVGLVFLAQEGLSLGRVGQLVRARNAEGPA
jgi:glycosyltransferase 2 family protein